MMDLYQAERRQMLREVARVQDEIEARLEADRAPKWQARVFWVAIALGWLVFAYSCVSDDPADRAAVEVVR